MHSFHLPNYSNFRFVNPQAQMYQDYLVQHLTSTILQYSLMNSFHFNGHTLGFYQQAQKLKPPVLKHNKRVLKGGGGGGGGV